MYIQRFNIWNLQISLPQMLNFESENRKSVIMVLKNELLYLSTSPNCSNVYPHHLFACQVNIWLRLHFLLDMHSKLQLMSNFLHTDESQTFQNEKPQACKASRLETYVLLDIVCRAIMTVVCTSKIIVMDLILK